MSAAAPLPWKQFSAFLFQHTTGSRKVLGIRGPLDAATADLKLVVPIAPLALQVGVVVSHLTLPKESGSDATF